MKKILLSLLLAACTMSMYAVDGMLSGYFSVSAEKTVAFSQGNLRAYTSDNGTTWNWTFAEHQWDYIGNNTANNGVSGDGTVVFNGSVDLFGWSTAATKYGIHNSKDNATYSGDFVDWGPRMGEGWFTLSKAEWVYLSNTRTNAANLRGQAVIDGKRGLVILPDDWTLPDGATFTAMPKNWTSNVYTLEQWSVMERAGAVFLPAAGYRDGTVLGSVDDFGLYWSSTPYDADKAFSFHYGQVYFGASELDARAYALSVRLVREPQVGDRFQAISGNDTLQYEVTQITPNLEVKVTQYGHQLKEETDLVIPASVQYVGKTFAVTKVDNGPQFGKAKTISLPNSLAQPVSWWIADLYSLEAFIVAEDNPLYTVVGGVLYTKDKTRLYRCPGKKAFKSEDFQPETKYLAGYAFYKTTQITDLVLPNTLQTTETGSFCGSSITSVVIPSSIKDLSNADFAACENLASVKFENSALVHLAWDAFNNSKIMTDQTGDFRVIDSIAVKYLGTAETVELPDSIVNVAYSFIFSEYAQATNLTTVILPATIKAVDEQFLSFNSPSDKFPKLEKIICKAQEVPHVFGAPLKINSAKDVKLVVPCGKVAAYTAATDFSGQFNAIEEECTATGIEQPTSYSSQKGRAEKMLRDGQLFIIRDGKTYNALGVEVR